MAEYVGSAQGGSDPSQRDLPTPRDLLHNNFRSFRYPPLPCALLLSTCVENLLLSCTPLHHFIHVDALILPVDPRGKSVKQKAFALCLRLSDGRLCIF